MSKDNAWDANADWSLIPDHCREGLRNYFLLGAPIGDFLNAVLCNKLVEAFGRADDINIDRLRDYANFLYNYAPSWPMRSWGSQEIVNEWQKMGGMQYAIKKLEEK